MRTKKGPSGNPLGPNQREKKIRFIGPSVASVRGGVSNRASPRPCRFLLVQRVWLELVLPCVWESPGFRPRVQTSGGPAPYSSRCKPNRPGELVRWPASSREDRLRAARSRASDDALRSAGPFLPAAEIHGPYS